jgi:predicted SAM-dependent methyltransferase
MKLDIGAGDAPAGDINIDVRKLTGIQVRASGLDLPFRDETFDNVHAAHVIEHLDKAEISPAIKEWSRVLRRTGSLEIICPNMLAIAIVMALKLGNTESGYFPSSYHLLDLIFGGQTHEHDYHKYGFTPSILLSMLRNHGFRKMDFRYPAPPLPAKGLHSLTSLMARFFPQFFSLSLWVDARK